MSEQFPSGKKKKFENCLKAPQPKKSRHKTFTSWSQASSSSRAYLTPFLVRVHYWGRRPRSYKIFLCRVATLCWKLTNQILIGALFWRTESWSTVLSIKVELGKQLQHNLQGCGLSLTGSSLSRYFRSFGLKLNTKIERKAKLDSFVQTKPLF